MIAAADLTKTEDTIKKNYKTMGIIKNNYLAAQLREALIDYGAIGFISQLTRLALERSTLIQSIQCGFGNAERPAEEDPAEVLRDLRANFAPDADRENGIDYFIHCFARLMQAVDCIDRTLNREKE